MEEILQKIVFVIGTRPQYIKASILVKKLEADYDVRIVDTGQHYDYNMSKVFTDELKMSTINLNIKSGTHGTQTAKVLAQVERILIKEKPDLVLNIGDTNSTLGSALAASKLNLPLAHIEAGCRCFDSKIPEEVNRIVTDALADYLFTSSAKHSHNLSNERVRGKIFFSGELLFDALKRYIPKIGSSLFSGDYVIATMHRNFNVDNPETFRNLLQAIGQSPHTVIMPLHPRSMKVYAKYNLERYKGNITILEPLGYLEMLNAIRYSKAVITDSGGVQREAFFLKKFCITLRDNTEWYETVECGANHLVGVDYTKIVSMLTNIPKFPELRDYHPYGDGHAADKIKQVIENEI